MPSPKARCTHGEAELHLGQGAYCRLCGEWALWGQPTPTEIHLVTRQWVNYDGWGISDPSLVQAYINKDKAVAHARTLEDDNHRAGVRPINLDMSR